MRKTITASLLLALGICALPAAAEPVASTSEIAQLLERLGDRCWAVDLDGAVLDAAALKQIQGPIDIELECVVDELKTEPAGPSPTTLT